MIPYQNPINKKHLCKNNHPLTCFSFANGVVFFADVFYLMNFDTVDVVSFDTKYLL